MSLGESTNVLGNAFGRSDRNLSPSMGRLRIPSRDRAQMESLHTGY